MQLPVGLGALRGLLKEVEVSARDERPLAVGGAPDLAETLRRELLARGGDPRSVRVGEPEGAAVYVYVIAGADLDEAALKRARRARVPIVALAIGSAADDLTLPHVLATDIVRAGAGESLPLDAVARRIAARLGEHAAPLAARIPFLRDAVCAELIGSFSRKNGLLGAAVFVPGADLPLLTLNQLRLVLRIAQAHGEDVGTERLPDMAATFGAGVALRAVARELLDLVPVAGWVVKGAIAYTGTRALGEAAVLRFGLGAPTRPRASASRGAS
jgi:uncharacterized protein (DUF697 family)